MRQTQIRAEFTEFVPEQMEEGVLYISVKFSIASHLCCCGCGGETVTPLDADGWTLVCEGDKPSLRPSIGNYRMPCKSHYLIEAGVVHWV